MDEKRKYPCCMYELEPDRIYRNFHTREIRLYGNELTLADGTVLYRHQRQGVLDSGVKMLVRCRKCGALLLRTYDCEYDMYDGYYSWEHWYPVATEEEADLLNILMDGGETDLPPVRHCFRSGWTYGWTEGEDPRPNDPGVLKDLIRKKYNSVNRDLLEDLIRKAGQEHMAEKIPFEPEPKAEEEEEEEDEGYEYLANFECEPPTLIRLGSFKKMEADLYAYPGVWKDTPHLNDIRVGIGCCMDYDSISEKTAMEIMAKLQKHYDRIREEREKETDPGSEAEKG